MRAWWRRCVRYPERASCSPTSRTCGCPGRSPPAAGARLPSRRWMSSVWGRKCRWLRAIKFPTPNPIPTSSWRLPSASRQRSRTPSWWGTASGISLLRGERGPSAWGSSPAATAARSWRAPVGDTARGGLVVDGRRLPTVVWKRMAALNADWNTRYGKYSSLDWDPTAFLMAMDDQGIDRMALYPSRGLHQVAAWGLDPKLAGAIVRAYNGWIHEFCAAGAGRLVGVGQLDLRDVDGA